MEFVIGFDEPSAGPDNKGREFPMFPADNDGRNSGIAIGKGNSGKGAAAPSPSKPLRSRVRSSSLRQMTATMDSISVQCDEGPKVQGAKTEAESKDVLHAKLGQEKVQRPRALTVISDIDAAAVSALLSLSPGGAAAFNEEDIDGEFEELRRITRGRALSDLSDVLAVGSPSSYKPMTFAQTVRRGERHLIGSYSPLRRQKRVREFMEKRKRRIWKKRIKYDVRKSFADSRLRVKGRFVKKSDEEIVREAMACS